MHQQKVEQTEWFKSWFDTPYYHILYKNRDDNEARRFINNLLQYLQPAPRSRVLDLACGSGRHSVYLAQNDLQVWGIDLSQNSIDNARVHEKANLHFDIHDMRSTYKLNFFDFEFSLFTSLGYFEKEEDDDRTFKAMSENLKPKGILAIDFMNSEKVIQNLVKGEVKTVDDIQFNIERGYNNGFIEKMINFKADDNDRNFIERVRAFKLEDFSKYLSKYGINIIATFGDYDLNPFDVAVSDRLILIGQNDGNSN